MIAETENKLEKSLPKGLSGVSSQILEHIADVQQVARVDCLMILLLRGNNLTSFDALYACQSLVYIDVSFNCIRHMPFSSFFRTGPVRLETLLCNHNYILDWRSIQESLESAHFLAILTLEGNPISWSSKYRRAVVNTAPNLKLFDQHPVAEEELIEDANFSFTRFAAPVFCELEEHVNTCWGFNPPLGLDFAAIGRIKFNFEDDTQLLTYARLILRTSKVLNGTLSPSTTIQRAYRFNHQKRIFEDTTVKLQFQISILQFTKRRYTIEKIQAAVRRYISNAKGIVDLGLLVKTSLSS